MDIWRRHVTVDQVINKIKDVVEDNLGEVDHHGDHKELFAPDLKVHVTTDQHQHLCLITQVARHEQMHEYQGGNNRIDHLDSQEPLLQVQQELMLFMKGKDTKVLTGVKNHIVEDNMKAHLAMKLPST